MGAKNREFDFDRDAAADVRGAFRGRPRRVGLARGELLHRFTTLGRNEVLGSPWWVPRDSFRRLTTVASRTGSPLRAAARSRLAVTRDWSPEMSWLCRVRVERGLVAWRGIVQHQPLLGSARDVLLIGGFEQLFVPYLEPADVLLEYFGSID